jgi:hypothetical protein
MPTANFPGTLFADSEWPSGVLEPSAMRAQVVQVMRTQVNAGLYRPRSEDVAERLVAWVVPSELLTIRH